MKLNLRKLINLKISTFCNSLKNCPNWLKFQKLSIKLFLMICENSGTGLLSPRQWRVATLRNLKQIIRKPNTSFSQQNSKRLLFKLVNTLVKLLIITIFWDTLAATPTRKYTGFKVHVENEKVNETNPWRARWIIRVQCSMWLEGRYNFTRPWRGDNRPAPKFQLVWSKFGNVDFFVFRSQLKKLKVTY